MCAQHSLRGFSLTEILVSLCLVTMALLALFKQSFHNTSALQYLSMRMQALAILDNASERVLMGLPLLYEIKPFQLDKQDHGTSVVLEVTWPMSSSEPESIASLKRTVVIR